MSHRIRKSIPVFAAGVLFFCTVSAQDLPHSLFREGRWGACLRECRRVQLQQGTTSSPKIKLLELSCRARLNQGEQSDLIDEFKTLANQVDDLETTAIASLEAGRLLWTLGQSEAALDAFASAFQSTTNQTLFLLAGCSAFLVMDENPVLKNGRTELVQQINTSRTLWFGKLFKQSRLEKDTPRFSFSPGHLFVHFYRTQISPAIGQRCTLDPSCSEYFHRAANRHGTLKAIPMTADRFVREPTVNNEKNEPVLINGMLRYRDSLCDHDFWMNP